MITTAINPCKQWGFSDSAANTVSIETMIANRPSFLIKETIQSPIKFFSAYKDKLLSKIRLKGNQLWFLHFNFFHHQAEMQRCRDAEMHHQAEIHCKSYFAITFQQRIHNFFATLRDAIFLQCVAVFWKEIATRLQHAFARIPKIINDTIKGDYRRAEKKL